MSGSSLVEELRQPEMGLPQCARPIVARVYAHFLDGANDR